MNDVVVKAPLKGGGGVVAIIPQDLDQVFRVATFAVRGQMAPDSLLKVKGEWKPFEDAVAACAVAIMAGAELGLTPMASLRSYAVVNGRPTLWGDGIKAVVRQSGICEFIKAGSDDTKGWCSAKRSDTGEELTKEFTWKQAQRAKLDKKPGPWQDFPDQMMERRATFRCLNDLFADILAGIVSAEEAQDYVDVTPDDRREAPPPAPPVPEEPPLKPADPAGAEATPESATVARPIDPAPQNTDDAHGGEPGSSTSEEPTRSDAEEFLFELEEALSGATTAAEVEAQFDQADVQVALDDEADIAKAFEIKKLALWRVNRPTEAEGQGDMLGGQPEDDAPPPAPRPAADEVPFPGDEAFPSP